MPEHGRPIIDGLKPTLGEVGVTVTLPVPASIGVPVKGTNKRDDGVPDAHLKPLILAILGFGTALRRKRHPGGNMDLARDTTVWPNTTRGLVTQHGLSVRLHRI